MKNFLLSALNAVHPSVYAYPCQGHISSTTSEKYHILIQNMDFTLIKPTHSIIIVPIVRSEHYIAIVVDKTRNEILYINSMLSPGDVDPSMYEPIIGALKEIFFPDSHGVKIISTYPQAVQQAGNTCGLWILGAINAIINKENPPATLEDLRNAILTSTMNDIYFHSQQQDPNFPTSNYVLTPDNATNITIEETLNVLDKHKISELIKGDNLIKELYIKKQNSD